jgi:hypothetical protein
VWDLDLKPETVRRSQPLPAGGVELIRRFGYSWEKQLDVDLACEEAVFRPGSQ